MSDDVHCESCMQNAKEITRLRDLLLSKDREIEQLRQQLSNKVDFYPNLSNEQSMGSKDIKLCTLNNNEILRYSRQIILPNIGAQGQVRMKNSSVLIVGAGGLGCPVGIYLAAAGVGKIGIIDYDDVEISNLHRQISHKEKLIGISKSSSLAEAIKEINSTIKCTPYNFQAKSCNMKNIAISYDIIVDASDNLPTRYLLNDVCVLLNKPLVSGSALRFEGQLTVYNMEDGPCFRCLYPQPAKPEATTNCSEGGVIGAVTGVIGCLQSLEVTKIILGLPPSFVNRLLHFDGESGQFHCFKLRGKNLKCDICSSSPKITDLIDYEMFCNVSATDKVQNIKILSCSDRISCMEYKNILDSEVPHLLIDVRPKVELDICSFSKSINITLNELKNAANVEMLRDKVKLSNYNLCYVVCRRGNDSQKAVQLLKDQLKDLDVNIFDIKGGYQAWHQEVDVNFPVY